MTPRLTVHDTTDCRSADSVKLTEASHRHGPGLVTHPYLVDLSCCKARGVIPFASTDGAVTGTGTSCCAPLSVTVSDVLCDGSEPEVAYLATHRTVAGVQHLQFRYHSGDEDPLQSMSRDHLPLSFRFPVRRLFVERTRPVEASTLTRDQSSVERFQRVRALWHTEKGNTTGAMLMLGQPS